MKKIFIFILLINISLNAEAKMIKTLFIEEQTVNHHNNKKSESIKKTYYAKDLTLIVDSALPYKVLINLKNKKVYFVDDINKQYSVTSLDQFRKISQTTNPVSSLSDEDVIIKETGNKKRVDKYSCFEVLILMPKLGIKTQAWMSKLKLPLDNYYNFSNKSKIGSNLTKIINLQKKYSAYTIESNTIPVSAHLKIENILIKLKNIKINKYPENFFKIPDTYEKIPLF